MLNIAEFQSLTVSFRDGAREPALVYGGNENIYHITKAKGGNYYRLRTTYPDDSVLTCACSSLSVAIANIEALERGEEI